MISPTQRPLPDDTQNSQETGIHAADGIRAHNPSKRAVADPRLRPRGHWDQTKLGTVGENRYVRYIGSLFCLTNTACHLLSAVPFSSFIAVTYHAQPMAHNRGNIEAGSDTRRLSDKTRTLYFRMSGLYVCVYTYGLRPAHPPIQ